MKTARRSSWRWLWLTWLIVPLLLWWALRGVPFSQISEALSGLRAWQVVILVAINLVILMAFSGRWWYLLRSMGHPVPYLALTRYRIASFAVSYFTPGTQFGGEPVQVYALEQRHAAPRDAAISSVYLDKVFEVLGNFTFLVIAFAIISLSGFSPGRWQSGLWLIILAILLLPALHLWALWRGWLPAGALLQRLGAACARWQWLCLALRTAQDAEQRLGDLLRAKPRVVLASLIFSIGVWLLLIFEYALMLAFIGLRLSLAEVVAALAAARLAFLVPVPGGLGALEASQVFAMQQLGHPAALGVTLSLLIRARDLLVGFAGLLLAASMIQKMRENSRVGIK